ncbi:DUF1631 family protein [Rhizobacter sp. P5_C2]
MPTAPLLKRFIDDELGRAPDLIARTMAAVVEQLRRPRDQLLASERQHHFDLVELLQQHAGRFQRAFVDALRQRVLADLEPADTTAPTPSGPSSLSGLQLMDEGRVESDIEISRAVQQIDTGTEWELRELQTFTSTLRGQAHTTAESNPLRPLAYAHALWDAAGDVTDKPVQQAILLRVASTAMTPLLRMAWAAACSRLESQGIEPSIYRTVVFAPGAGAARKPEVDVTMPGALEGLVRSMPGGDPTTAPSSPSERPAATGRGAALGPALEQALARIEAMLSRLPAGTGTGNDPDAADRAGTPSSRLAEFRGSLLTAADETIERQIIELLSRLFETILGDPMLPQALRTLMGRLQVSALRVALRDPKMMEIHDHPVWQLMDRIAGAAVGYPQSGDPRLAQVLAFCDRLVDEMLAEPVQDAALYRRSIARVDACTAEQLRDAQVAARGAIATLVMAEQRERLQRELAHRLTEQMAPIRTTPVIRRFVTGTWARVLAESFTLYGEEAETSRLALKATDHLLWSLRLPDHPQSRLRLLGLLPGLLQQLRAGMALIALPAAEQQAALDALVEVHTEAMKPGARPAVAAAEPEPTPEELVRRMRDETVEPVPETGTPFSDSLIDLGSMDTVPAEWLPSGPAAGGDDAAAWVNAMAIGRHYRVFLLGRWSHLQLLWRSDGGQLLLFAGEQPDSTHSVTLRALERLRSADLLIPLADYSLVQRAVDGMLRSLATLR